MDGYNVVKRDRSSDAHGGVCTYISNNIVYNDRLDLHNEHIEAVWIEIVQPNTKPIVIGTVYRPPDQHKFVEYFGQVLSSISKEVIILGDFNINWLNRSCKLYKDYNNLLNLVSLSQIINTPTRVTSTTSSIIDHILVSDINKISK